MASQKIIDKQELSDKVRFIIDEGNELEILFYVVMKNSSLLKLDMDEEATNSLIPDFRNAIKKVIIDQDYTIKEFSSAEDRKGCYFIYDIEETPKVFDHIRMAGSNIEIEFFSKKNNIKDIKGLITVIAYKGEMVRLYRPIYGFDISITKDRHMFFIEANKRFVKFSEEVLNITPSFCLISIDDNFIIVDVEKMEKDQKLTNIIFNEANRLIEELEKVDLIEDINVIFSNIKENLRLAKKLISTMKSSQVLKKKIPNSKIIEFAKTKVKKIGNIPINEKITKFSPIHKIEVERIIKLFSDDLLKSELTDEEYDSSVKDLIVIN